MSNKKRIIKISAIIVSALLLISVAGFFIWANVYYKAEPIALEIFSSLESTGKAEIIDNNIILHPDMANGTGLIFYPGAKVETLAYIPLFDELRQRGYTCVLIEMPFNMAIFDTKAADDVYELVPHIEKWYISGHSMGGGMASDYASNNPEKVEGLILMGAYVYGDYPPSKALTVYGTFNSDLEKYIDYLDNIVILDGGNHAQFGNYGKQKGDPDATITAKEQQMQTVDAIVDFIGIE